MSRRTQPRDRRGRFTRLSKAYVPGSFTDELTVGRVAGPYKGATAGAKFRSSAGRGVMVRATVGYHGTPNRRIDIAPSLDLKTKKLTLAARPNPARRSTATRRRTRR